MLKTLIFDLDVLSDVETEEYTEFKYDEIQEICDNYVVIDGIQLAKSQLKCDIDKNLYLINWLYNKYFG